MKRTVLIAFAILIAGCATQPPPAQAPYIPAAVTNPSVTKPIDVGPDPVAELPEEIRIAYEQPDPPIVHDGISTVYPYDPHQQPTINCAILRVTEIVLGAGETVKANDLGIGDSVRWSVTAADNRILVKPAEPGIATDLVVVTNLRSYHFALRTHVPYQPQVSFYYPDEITAAENHHRELIRQALAQSQQSQAWSKPLNFAYSIKGPAVAWRPVLAFDDGDHFYIEFPQNITGTDMPTLMSQSGKQQEVVNYQVRGQYYVADRLLPAAVLTSGTGTNRQAIEITASR